MPALRLLLALVLTLAGLTSAQAQRRVALVIGNAAYADSPLKNPVNDARAMDAKLRQLGFAVTKVENLQRAQIGRTLSAFAGGIRAGDEVVVFYAGHGLQVKGVNYLTAVDADIHTEDDVPLNSLNLNSLLDRLDEAKAGVKLLFLDACRNNPYARSFRSAGRGLARVQDVPSGTLMHFATRPGSVAADGSGANGLYTTELLKAIDQPGLPVEQMLKRVAANVERASQGQQEPWVEGSLKGEFYFRVGSVAHAAAPEGRHSALDLGDLRRQAEHDRQASAMQERMQSDFDEVAGFSGPPALRVQAWERWLAAWRDPVLPGPAVLALRQRAQLQLAAARALTGVPPRQGPTVTAGELAAQVGLGGVAALARHCEGCPDMVTIPAGRFMMGSPLSEPGRSQLEGPPRSVSVQAFLMGRTEVTMRQWKAVMGPNTPEGIVNCGDDCPVEAVTWDGVQRFLQQLNRQTGRVFRLPTEAEWEYAARAGSTTAYSWGPQASHEHANYGTEDCCPGRIEGRDRWLKWAPVAQFPPNAFGLHDMHGNVQEWVQDCFGSYSSAPNNGQAADAANCKERVARGGHFMLGARLLRSAYRGTQAQGAYSRFTGFRVAMSLP